MRKLRRVEEYRDRRIVTDGERYGVEAELITDCRYLNVAGARAAIDSELGIARRKTDLQQHREALAAHIAREGRDWAYACDCGWRGRYNALKQTGAPKFFSCPACSSQSIVFSMTADAEPMLGSENKSLRAQKTTRRSPA